MIWRIQKTTELTRGVGKANNHFVVSVKDMSPEVMTSRTQQAATSSWTWTPMRSNSRCEQQHKTCKCGYYLKAVGLNPFSGPIHPMSRTCPCHCIPVRIKWGRNLWSWVELLPEGFFHLSKGVTNSCPFFSTPGVEVRDGLYDLRWEIKLFSPVQTLWFYRIGHRVNQKHCFTWQSCSFSARRAPRDHQLIPFHGPKKFMTCPRSQSLVAELGLESGSLDS